MATGQQTGGITPSRQARADRAVRPVYEDFTPTSEWKKQEQSQLLLVYLPGFAKEQINVSVERKNTLRVRGESLVRDNKWSRFQEDFRIPEDCNISGVRAKFEGETLTVTFPNKTSPLAQVGPTKQEAKTPTREATSRPGEQEAKTPSREATSRRGDQVPPKTISAVSEAKKTEGKGITEGPSSPKVATEPLKSQKGQGETPPKPAPSTASAKQPADGKGVGSTSAAKIIPGTTETKETSEGKGNLAEVRNENKNILDMATGQQTGGITPSRPARAGHTVRPVYEDFTPTSEWKKQEQSQLVLVYLPGFAKEQINVSVEDKNSLRVRGESLVRDNKWSRFQEDFRIPEDCNISGVRAKFEGETLTVTLPNKTSPLAQVGPTKQEAKTPTREATSLPGDQVPPKTISAVSEAKKTEGNGITEGLSSPKVATEPPKPQKGQGENAKIIPRTTETKERSEGKGNLAEVKTPENIALEKAVQKEKDIDEKGKESLVAENYIEKVVKKEKEESGGTATVWKPKIAGFSEVPKQKQTTDDVASGGGGSYEGFAEKYKQAMEELIAKRENLNEERQLLLNMGTAILVIVALGAYISYTIGGSSGNTEH
ncbi:inactive protein RESTRICTED TEV MOVEMENT 2 [Rhododendron vialii]|uniref:inactive protein RESTRICTED TEV MOVEMENT 2 n=1 Tax=Rhododendron vialii TaxID=182163 RepID=UPI00265DD45A|nr:inactive protein RESTRICTED TEV MOVEMENT 2 [Rhododendron vialii]